MFNDYAMHYPNITWIRSNCAVDVLNATTRHNAAVQGHERTPFYALFAQAVGLKYFNCALVYHHLEASHHFSKEPYSRTSKVVEDGPTPSGFDGNSERTLRG